MGTNPSCGWLPRHDGKSRCQKRRVVTVHPEETVATIGAYVDGASVQTSESATSFWIIDTVTLKRFLAAMLRHAPCAQKSLPYYWAKHFFG